MASRTSRRKTRQTVRDVFAHLFAMYPVHTGGRGPEGRGGGGDAWLCRRWMDTGFGSLLKHRSSRPPPPVGCADTPTRWRAGASLEPDRLQRAAIALQPSAATFHFG